VERTREREVRGDAGRDRRFALRRKTFARAEAGNGLQHQVEGYRAMKWILAAVAGTILALGIAFANRVGAFKDVSIDVTEQGPHKIVFRRHDGAYHKIVPAIEEVEKWARANGETCKLSFGEFLDDPKVVDEDRLKSNGGCLVEKEWSAGLPEHFSYREVPRRKYLIAKFDGAPGIGPLKVYPRATREIADRGLQMDGPVIELYEILPENRVLTTYLFPVRP
jgi:AraC family transcriptional regulator